MMVSKTDLSSLISALYGGNEVMKNSQGQERYQMGNLWFGDYYSKCESSQFGTKIKSDHFGCIADFRKKKRAMREILPITSQRSSKKQSYILKTGIIRSGKNSKSYILLNEKLKFIVRTDTLIKDFKYEGLLPELNRTELQKELHKRGL